MGIDLIAVFADTNASGGKDLHLWYAQCRMSQDKDGRIGPASSTHSAADLIEGFGRDRSNLHRFVTSSGQRAAIVEEYKVLITCCLMSPRVRGQLQDKSIHIIDREALASHWPDRTRDYLKENQDKLGFLLES